MTDKPTTAAGVLAEQLGPDPIRTRLAPDTRPLARTQLASSQTWQCQDCQGTQAPEIDPEAHAQANPGHQVQIYRQTVEVIHT